MGLFKSRTCPKLMEIPVKEIFPNPNQPRQVFEPETLEQLAQSIEINGLLQPIVVRSLEDGSYELIAGERRLKAVQLLGKSHIAALVKMADQQESSVLALIENIQRENLNFVEEALSYQRLLELLDISQQQLAERLGKSQSTIANKLRLLKIPQELMDKIIAYQLTERHARAILKITDRPDADKLIDYIGQQQLNVTQTEQYIDGLEGEKEAKPRKTTWVVRDVRIFANTIQKAIDVMKEAGICAVSSKKEDENSLTYIVTIPKSAAYKPSKIPDRISV